MTNASEFRWHEQFCFCSNHTNGTVRANLKQNAYGGAKPINCLIWESLIISCFF